MPKVDYLTMLGSSMKAFAIEKMNYKLHLNSESFRKIFDEVYTIFRFGVVGLCATGIHLFISLYLLKYNEFSAVTANVSGFAIAFIFAFIGHSFWTFPRSNVPIVKAVLRFLAISLLGLAANNLLLLILLQLSLLNDTVAVLISILIIPPISFLGIRFWALRR